MRHTVLCTGALALAAAAYSAAQTPPSTPRAVARPATTPPAATQKVDWSVAMIERAKKKGIKMFDCPAALRSDPAGNFGPTSLAWKSASAYANRCAPSSDLAPANDRGNFCLTCYYDLGVELQRSGPKDHTCWVKPDDPNSFACEYVAPAPPPPITTTCNFQLRPADVNLYPLDHISGDRDMATDHGSLDFLTGRLRSSVSTKVDAAITREGDNLVLIVSGYMGETEGDHSFFGKSVKFVIGDRGDILNGSKADVNACFAAYGAQRPFSGTSGQQLWTTGGFRWFTWEASRAEGGVKFSTHCKVDQEGSNDKIGCDRIRFEPFNVLIK